MEYTQLTVGFTWLTFVPWKSTANGKAIRTQTIPNNQPNTTLPQYQLLTGCELTILEAIKFDDIID
jgi:hypothetical protein